MYKKLGKKLFSRLRIDCFTRRKKIYLYYKMGKSEVVHLGVAGWLAGWPNLCYVYYIPEAKSWAALMLKLLAY
jgi:hypothetical protein